MTKYSSKFKLQLVEEYMECTLDYRLLARKYGSSVPSLIKCRVCATRLLERDSSRNRRAYRTIIHSNQCWHYQNFVWTKAFEEAAYLSKHVQERTYVDRAMENFFSLLKQGIYWREAVVSYEELKQWIDKYIAYYINERINQKFAGIS